MRAIQNKRHGKLTIRVLSAVNEIECSYRLDDTSMELIITLPDDYPLGLPKMTGRSVVSEDLNRKWLFQLQIFVSRQVIHPLNPFYSNFQNFRMARFWTAFSSGSGTLTTICGV
jgi:hypothetical protein